MSTEIQRVVVQLMVSLMAWFLAFELLERMTSAFAIPGVFPAVALSLLAMLIYFIARLLKLQQR